MNNNLNEFMWQEKEDVGIKFFKQTIPVNIYHFYVTGDIERVDRYINMINILKTAEAHDTIFIYLNTNGGHLNTSLQIVAAIKQSNATVVTCLEGEVASAGTIIFLAGSKYLVAPNCSFLIHSYSGMIGGKGNEIAAHSRFREEYWKQLMKDTYDKFLTDEEIESVIDGKDIWLSSEEVVERLEIKNKLCQEESENQDNNQDEIIGEVPKLLEKIIKEEVAQPIQRKKKKKAPKPDI